MVGARGVRGRWITQCATARCHHHHRHAPAFEHARARRGCLCEICVRRREHTSAVTLEATSAAAGSRSSGVSAAISLDRSMFVYLRTRAAACGVMGEVVEMWRLKMLRGRGGALVVLGAWEAREAAGTVRGYDWGYVQAQRMGCRAGGWKSRAVITRKRGTGPVCRLQGRPRGPAEQDWEDCGVPLRTLG